ncbi:MAG: DUF3883 domain-containing protein [Candidatus Bathyarchaeia archaeon]
MISKEDIENMAAEIAAEYAHSPIRLIEDSRSERNIAESEQGRYVLELLQNADDAQIPDTSDDTIKIGQPEVVFLVTDKYLYCANGGFPISKEGLRSICRAFLSPKRKNAPVIGFKGIGFKSVLALTEQPEIFWSDGGVYFSRERTFEYLKLKAPNALADVNPDEVPILRCPHPIDLNLALKEDPTLKSLLTNSATVFRFPLINDTTRQNLVNRLNDIKASTVLFLNNLKTIKIVIDGDVKIYRISKENAKFDEGNGVTYDIAHAHIQDEESKSNWIIISGIYKLPLEIKKRLSLTWKDTDYIRISYAVEVNDLGKPIPCSEYPLLHVFFPTEERIPFRILIHGTFKTNVDRRLLTQEDPLNDYAITKSIELLRDKVLPLISEELDDPGKIMDFLQPPKDLNISSTEGKIWTELCEDLRNHKFVPNRRNNKKLSPQEVILSPIPRDVEVFKYLTENKLTDRFCYDTIDINEDRRQTLQNFGAKVLEVTELPKFFEDNFTHEIKWVANMYALLDNISSYLESINPTQKKVFIEEIKKRKLLLLAGGETVAAELITHEGAIFFPPTAAVPTPPKGLNLRFLERSVIDEYLKIISKTVRQTFFVRDLEIEEYAAIPVITKIILPAIREFWQQWPTKKIFEPEKVLQFLYALLGDDLPKDERLKAISLMPVPVKGEPYYAPACDTYASKEWTGNDSLEFIYGSESAFLAPPDNMLNDELFGKMKLFYQWLGVAWLPRIISQFKDFEENKWRSCRWTYEKRFESPHSKLPNWEKYCKTVYEECEPLGGESPFQKYETLLETSWALDRFDKIVTDPEKSRRLLSILAANWDTHYSKFVKCTVLWRTKSQQYYRFSEVTSYFFWQLTRSSWVPSSKFDIWSFRKPSELFIKTESVYNELGDLIPYVEVSTDGERILLTRLGVKTSLDDLTAEDWWRIAIDIPRLLNPDERVVRPLYRKMMQVKDIEKESNNRTDFMSNGKLLALVNGKPEFVDRDEVWYVESEEFRRLFGKHIPIFIIQHEERRGAAIKRTFEINVLEDYLHPELEIGEEDKPTSDMLNQFLDSVKAFLVARVYAQRPSREDEDVSAIRRLKLKTVKSLKVSYNLNLGDKTIEVASDKGTYLDKQNSIIFIDAGRFHVKDLKAIEEDPKLASELGVQIAYYLGIDLANDFMLLIKSNDELRYEILDRANVSKMDIENFRISLKQEAVPRLPIVTAIPTVQQTPQLMVHITSTPTISENLPQPQIRPLELWTPSELGFKEPIEMTPTPEMKHAASGSGSGSGTSHPAYISDQEERKKVDQAGIDLVKAYEKHRHEQEHNCSPTIESREKQSCGYDIISECDVETRRIEVKSSKGDMQVVELTALEWDAARNAENRDNHFLYRVRYLDKRSGKEPEIVIIRNPYSALIGEPTRFKVRLNKLQGKMQIVQLTRSEKEPNAQ